MGSWQNVRWSMAGLRVRFERQPLCLFKLTQPDPGVSSPTGVNLGVFATAMDSTCEGIAFDAQGNLYVPEHNLNDIRKFSRPG